MSTGPPGSATEIRRRFQTGFGRRLGALLGQPRVLVGFGSRSGRAILSILWIPSVLLPRSESLISNLCIEILTIHKKLLREYAAGGIIAQRDAPGGHRRWSIYDVEKANPGGRRHLVTLRLGRDGSDAARRAGGLASMQA